LFSEQDYMKELVFGTKLSETIRFMKNPILKNWFSEQKSFEQAFWILKETYLKRNKTSFQKAS
jgi:hypothetical protein